MIFCQVSEAVSEVLQRGVPRDSRDGAHREGRGHLLHSARLHHDIGRGQGQRDRAEDHRVEGGPPQQALVFGLVPAAGEGAGRSGRRSSGRRWTSAASTRIWPRTCCRRGSWGAKSRWHVYISILPRKFETIPLFFDEQQRQELVGSISLKKIDDRLESLRLEYEALCGAVPEYTRFSLNDFIWG